MLMITFVCIILGGTITSHLTHNKSMKSNYSTIILGGAIGGGISYLLHYVFKNNLEYVAPFNLRINF